MSDERGVVSSAAWWDDPTGRFDQRYHNGVRWTADVASDGVRYVDPLPGDPGTAVPPADPGRPAGSGGRNGAAIAALVLGIVGLLLGWVPYVFVVGAIAAVLAIVLGVVGLRRARTSGDGRAASTAGLVTGAVGLVAAVVGFFFTIAFSDALAAYDSPADHSAQVTACTRLGTRWTATVVLRNLSADEADFTVDVGFVRPGTDNVQRSDTLLVDDVPAGEERELEAQATLENDAIECTVVRVRGPRPFGFDPD